MKKLTVLIILIISILPLYSQTNNADSTFNLAINYSRAGNYEKAVEEAQKVLNTHPERFDVIIFIANLFAWQGNYETALIYIDRAYLLTQTAPELYDTWLNILLWSNNYKKLLEIAELAQQNNYQNNYNLVLKKTLAHKALAEYSAGIELIEMHKNLLDSTAIKTLYNEMIIQKRTKAITILYSTDYFETNTPEAQHSAYIDFAQKLDKHILFARINYANRFNINDLQPEIDYYHVFKNGQYAYINYGLGIKQKLFPQHKGGFEYFIPFRKTFETSIGARIFYADGKNTYIITTHLSKYIANFWFSMRPFYVIHNRQKAITTVLNLRYFGKNPINYWAVEFLYGNSPDERYEISVLPERLSLKNYRFKIEKKNTLFAKNEIKFSIAYTYEEYSLAEFRNRFSPEIVFIRNF